TKTESLHKISIYQLNKMHADILNNTKTKKDKQMYTLIFKTVPSYTNMCYKKHYNCEYDDWDYYLTDKNNNYNECILGYTHFIEIDSEFMIWISNEIHNDMKKFFNGSRCNNCKEIF